MSPLWRGFAGFVAVFLLAYFVSDLEKKIEDEKALVHSAESGHSCPLHVALERLSVGHETRVRVPSLPCAVFNTL